MLERTRTFARRHVVALAALTVALGGTSYAASSLPKNSVGSKQIAKNAVRSIDVKDGSLLAKDFKKGQLPAGDTGPAGPAGRSALSELKRGDTIRGAVGLDVEVVAAGGDYRTTASFAIPGATAPGTVYVDTVSAGETCTGTAAAPTAPVGTLCVYPLSAANPSPGAGSHVIVNQTAFGFSLSWEPTGPGDSFFNGVYAYTQG